MLNRIIVVFALIAALVGVVQPPVKAQSAWGPWETTGVGISIRVARVNNTTVTWAFRNDTNRTLRSMDFDYTFVDAGTNQVTTQHDILLFPMASGGSFGGWTAYTANTRGEVSIAIKNYKFDN
ncbi:MAG: hypothetical protein ABSA96_04495 [Candidatus Acidiferrales bacterium]|jgi:hypothetical protein